MYINFNEFSDPVKMKMEEILRALEGPRLEVYSKLGGHFSELLVLLEGQQERSPQKIVKMFAQYLIIGLCKNSEKYVGARELCEFIVNLQPKEFFNERGDCALWTNRRGDKHVLAVVEAMARANKAWIPFFQTLLNQAKNAWKDVVGSEDKKTMENFIFLLAAKKTFITAFDSEISSCWNKYEVPVNYQWKLNLQTLFENRIDLGRFTDVPLDLKISVFAAGIEDLRSWLQNFAGFIEKMLRSPTFMDPVSKTSILDYNDTAFFTLQDGSEYTRDSIWKLGEQSDVVKDHRLYFQSPSKAKQIQAKGIESLAMEWLAKATGGVERVMQRAQKAPITIDGAIERFFGFGPDWIGYKRTIVLKSYPLKKEARPAPHFHQPYQPPEPSAPPFPGREPFDQPRRTFGSASFYSGPAPTPSAPPYPGDESFLRTPPPPYDDRYRRQTKTGK